MKKLLVFLILIGVCCALGAYGLNGMRPSKPGEAGFTTAVIERGSLTDTVSATGLLQPREVIAVGSELSGRIIEIYPAAEVNSIVREGEPLLLLDDRMAKLKLEQAETAVRLAEADIPRAEAARDALQLKVTRLREALQSVGFQKDLDESTMQLQAATATVAAARIKVEEALNAKKQAQLGLDLTVVRASFRSGISTEDKGRRYVVLDRKAVLGQLIAPPVSAQLFTLARDLGQMDVHTQISENDINKMRVGMEATFTVYAYADEDSRFRAKVAEIKPTPISVQGAVFYDTVLHVTNARDPSTKEWKLRPGMTAAVDLILRQHRDAWKMPLAALSLQVEDLALSESAQEKLDRWKNRADADDWQPVWIFRQDHQPWPMFVRIGGKTKEGESGIRDSQFVEVLEWDPELGPNPGPTDPAALPLVITAAPPSNKGGLLDKVKVKLF